MLRLFFSIILFPLRLLFFIFYRLTLLRKRSVLRLRLPDRFTLFESSGWMSRFFSRENQAVGYFPFLFLLRRIRKTKGLQQLILEIPAGFETALDWSQIFDVAAELDRIREAGIRIVGHSSGGGLQSLLLLSRADLRLIGPGLLFQTALPHRESFYYADLLAQVGLQVEVYHAGKFKSAGESLSRTGSSAAARENMMTLLNRIRSLILDRFEKTPSFDAASYARFKKLLHDQSLCTGDDLVNTGFVNAVIEQRHLIGFLATGKAEETPIEHAFLGRSDELTASSLPSDSAIETMAYEKRLIDADAFMKRERRRDYRPFRLRRPPSLAIAALHGAIVQGRLGDAPRAENVVTQAWLELFDELEEGPDKAVILYVDSPGGLADASELLYQQIRRLSRKKPVLAYFGGVAASGGYYLACAANRIYSSPVSLTGSIGVIRMRPQASGLLKKLHIKSERLLFDETTDLLSPTDKPGRKSRKLLEASTASTYLDFMRRVAAGRGLTAEAVLAAAGGRVYVADELKETALIDATTDLIALIELFRKESNMKDGQALDIRLLPELQFSLRSVLRSGLPLSGSSVEISEALDAMLSLGGGWLKHLLLLRKEIMQDMVSGTPMLLDATLSLFSLSKRTSEDTTRSFRAAKKAGGKDHGRALVHALTKRRYPF